MVTLSDMLQNELGEDTEYVYLEFVQDALEDYVQSKAAGTETTKGVEALAYLADQCGLTELSKKLRG